MIWGFVDYENTGSLEGIDISAYERLMVFCGPKNKRVKFGELSTAEFVRFELIGIQAVSSNNLDFHISFYLGRLHETADKGVEFHIISNDSGFNGIVSHLNNIGRNCKKVTTKIITKKVAKKTQSIKELSECAKLVASRLKQMDGRKRPRKKNSLDNWVKSQCGHLRPAVTANTILKELASDGKIVINSSNVAYQL